MKCSNCGAENGDNVKFCASCGHDMSLSGKLVEKLDKGEFKSAVGTAAATAVNAGIKVIQERKQKGEEIHKKVEEEINKKVEKKKAEKEKERKREEWFKKYWYILVIIVVAFITLLIVVGVVSSNKDKANHPNQVKAPTSSEMCKGEDYESIVAKFKNAGFENIKTEKITDLITGWVTKDGSVEKVLINGDPDYSTSTWYLPTDEVVIRYHTFSDSTDEEETTENVTEDTTEEKTTVMAEDAIETDVYAYIRKFSDYSIYIIVDLNEGAYYYFTVGTGDNTCDRIAFENGNLNDGITSLFHDAGEVFEERIAFKSEDKTDILVLTDPDGYEFEFKQVDISEAKDAKSSKRIIDR